MGDTNDASSSEGRIFTTNGTNHNGDSRNNGKVNENSALASNRNQTYFVDKKIKIPETDSVCINISFTF